MAETSLWSLSKVAGSCCVLCTFHGYFFVHAEYVSNVLCLSCDFVGLL